jgi:ABC-type lipoprotein release transport system permease subunit
VKLKDYMVLGWDQLKRRMVVTALCALGIAIGSASIIVALAFGESITHYAKQQLNSFLKMDEISVQGAAATQTNGSSDGQNVLSKQKIDLIRKLPHVKSAAMFGTIDYIQFRVDDTKMGSFQLMEADMEMLPQFGYDFQQGSVSDQENTIVISYSSIFDLYDERIAQIQNKQANNQGNNQGNNNIRLKPVAYPLYQKRLILTQYSGGEGTAMKKVEFPVRVVGVLKRPEGVTDSNVNNNKMAFISHGLAERIRNVNATELGRVRNDRELKIKVDNPSNVAQVEKLIQKLQLPTQSNIHYQERTNSEFTIVRLIFGGAGLFILCVASISIIVAMTMSTYQRRRQIGIMKVLGANLSQIRNMFIVESALLGILGGAIGILFSYWVIWAINIVVQKFAHSDEILFISFWILPVGLFFALLTGILSGIYPAIKASRTDALTAIKRE